MSANSKIEWTGQTWNPITGCTPVSPGCEHCYAKAFFERFHGPGSFASVDYHEDRLLMPFSWREPKLVFVNSMSDLFHPDVPDEVIAEVFAVMLLARRHTFQVLTKHHGRMRSLLNDPEFRHAVRIEACTLTTLDGVPDEHDDAWPLPNLWLGVSAENQQWADIRMKALVHTPAAVRWVSMEPLLGPIRLHRGHAYCPVHDFPGGFCTGGCPDVIAPDWIVAGGESGPKARPMHPDWIRSLRDQCAQNAIPFFFKQWGSWAPHGQASALLHRDGWRSRAVRWIDPAGVVHPFGDFNGDQSWSRVQRGPKHLTGRELDGRTWDEMPEARS